MLFCSDQFLVFFTMIFTAYWVLEWHWGRLGVVFAAGLYLVHGTLQGLDSKDVAYATAAVVAVPAAAAFWIGTHRGRVWLLLAASFYFYASWNKWLALVV